MATGNWTEADVLRINALRSVKRPLGAKAVDIAPAPGAPKPSKYHNIRTMTPDGEKFDSAKEAEYWLVLKIQEQAGEITELERQVDIPLYCPNKRGHATQVSAYRCDFRYRDKAKAQHVVDVKGLKTRMYLLKKKWLELQDGIIITEV